MALCQLIRPAFSPMRATRCVGQMLLVGLGGLLVMRRVWGVGTAVSSLCWADGPSPECAPDSCAAAKLNVLSDRKRHQVGTVQSHVALIQQSGGDDRMLIPATASGMPV
jgi:hypothetical protein